MIAQLSVVSFRVSNRSVAVRFTLTALVIGLALVSLRFGTYPISTSELIGFLVRGGDSVAALLFLEYRLPRVLTAIGTGIAFGISGALFQTLLRNPLASPDWIGFTPGASFGALCALYLTGGYVIGGALIGIAVTSSIVLLLAMDGGLNTGKLIIIGIGASLTLGAGADLLLARVDAMTAADMTKWLVGSLNGRDWNDVHLIYGALIISLPVVFVLTFPMKSLVLHDDIARGHGVAITPMRILTVIAGVILVAIGVCVAGPLPFVAFLCGPTARVLEQQDRPSMLSAALVGAAIVLVADYVARLTPLVQLPTGVFTALIGAPFLIWLIVAAAKKGRI